jgi:hypothetical protein
LTTPYLTIQLRDPGDADDRLCRYRVCVSNDFFSGMTDVWAYPENLSELSSAIAGFPASPQSVVRFEMGAKSVGEAKLEFRCVDGSGHAVIWATLVSSDPVRPSAQFQQASVCLRIEPSQVDEFCGELLALAGAQCEIAKLCGNEP